MHNIQSSQIGNRRRRTAEPLSQEDVLAAVVELSTRYRAPSTSLLTWRLARGATVSATFQSEIRDALQHLRASGQLSCVMHRGTHRWSATPERAQPPGGDQPVRSSRPFR